MARGEGVARWGGTTLGGRGAGERPMGLHPRTWGLQRARWGAATWPPLALDDR